MADGNPCLKRLGNPAALNFYLLGIKLITKALLIFEIKNLPIFSHFFD